MSRPLKTILQEITAAICLAATRTSCSSGGEFTIPTSGNAATLAVTPQIGNERSAALVGQLNPPLGKQTSRAPHIVQFGGEQGSTWVSHKSNDVFGYSEILTATFDRPFNATSVTKNVTISPSAAWSQYSASYGKMLLLTIRKVPGISYKVTFQPSLEMADGTKLLVPTVFSFTTPAKIAIPAPARVGATDRYRYGTLEHPYPFSLSGPTADAQIALLARSGIGFVRIDYPGEQIEPSRGVFSFDTEDAILAKLAKHNITEMPIIEQYSAPGWANENQAYPAIFALPADFAAFAGAIVAHLHKVAPQVTHVELFNEPNLAGWWTDPNPAYAARTGAPTAAYAEAAYAAIKKADARMIVVGPALADGGESTEDPRIFLTNMMDAGCRVGTCWDELSVHPYAWLDPSYKVDQPNSSRLSIYKDLQSIALSHGDKAKPHVFLTEWGYSTDETNASGFDPSVQALYLAKGLNIILSDPTVDGVVWTNIYNPGTDFWGRTAITNTNMTPLAAFGTLQAFTGR